MLKNLPLLSVIIGVPTSLMAIMFYYLKKRNKENDGYDDDNDINYENSIKYHQISREIKVPNDCTGYIIGPNGTNIKSVITFL
jgi:hypothetical protein